MYTVTPASLAPGPVSSLGKIREAAAATIKASDCVKKRSGMRMDCEPAAAETRLSFRSSEYTSTPPMLVADKIRNSRRRMREAYHDRARTESWQSGQSKRERT